MKTFKNILYTILGVIYIVGLGVGILGVGQMMNDFVIIKPDPTLVENIAAFGIFIVTAGLSIGIVVIAFFLGKSSVERTIKYWKGSQK